MENFIATAEPDIKLSGAEKTAILLGELGMAISDDLLERVGLSEREKKAINKAFKKLGKYNPQSRFEARREVQVLQEVMDYGAYKGILPPPKPDFYQQKQQEVLGMMKQNPDAVANLLKAWLGDDD
ncbi:hypothetical protein MSI_03020 [Treponema sp. JC4]|uniref:hypothetical protein n=1 Tax=Treponema sp. JC4 TaxID=1124982 RepID=UPI00025B0474|nr:hypothetical protein [Treponema sp. JC4]EID85874.1 hypothetical protein MSI_03020 [Treponema sp. JC4]